MKIFKDQLINLSGCNQPGKVRVMTTITQYDLRYKIFDAIKEELGLPELSLEVSAISMDETGNWHIDLNIPIGVAKELVGNIA